MHADSVGVGAVHVTGTTQATPPPLGWLGLWVGTPSALLYLTPPTFYTSYLLTEKSDKTEVAAAAAATADAATALAGRVQTLEAGSTADVVTSDALNAVRLALPPPLPFQTRASSHDAVLR